MSEADFKAELRAEGVQVLDTGNRFVFVDHKSRTVYDEDELGEMFKRERWMKAFAERTILRLQPITAKTITQPVAVKPAVGEVVVHPVRVSPASPPVVKPAKVPLKPQRVSTDQPANETAKPVVEVPPSQSVRPGLPVAKPAVEAVPRPLTGEEAAKLRRQLSQVYQKLRTEGMPGAGGAGQPPLYFESQLIARFPHQALTDALVAQGVTPGEARKAVTDFEAYKQGQLPDIRAKEQSYFEQTTSLLLKLARTMPISAASRRAFLLSMELDLVGFDIRHRQNDALSYPLSLAQQTELRSQQGVDVAFPQKASKPVRTVYLALAGDQPAPSTVSYYQVGAYHLQKSIGPDSFQKIAPSLNVNYLTQVQAHLEKNRVGGSSLLMQLASRGIVVEKRADASYWAGHTLSGQSTFVKLDQGMAARLSQELLLPPGGRSAELPPLSVQRQAQQTPAVRQLVRLSQAIDQRDEAHIQRVSSGAKGQELLTSNNTGLTVQQTLQKALENLYAPPALRPAPTEKLNARQQVTPPTHVPPSGYGQAVISMLLKAGLTPAERGDVARQLGLQWQAAPGGRVQVVEQAGSPRPGAVYTLSADQRHRIEPSSQHADAKPSVKRTGEPPRRLLQLNDDGRVLMAHWLGGQPLSDLPFNGPQIARLQINRLVSVMGPEQHHALQTWYNEARGHQIIGQQPPQEATPAATRRYLSDLYQRGFIVHQSADNEGKPRYRMGALSMAVATYAPLPDWLSQQVEKVTAPLKPMDKTGVFLIIAGWCEPGSTTNTRMQRLARALDGEQPAGVQAAISLIQQKYPALRSVADRSVLLDALVSLPTARLQQAKPVAVAELEAALDSVSGRQAAATRTSFQGLGAISLVKPTLKPSVGQALIGRHWKPG